MSEIISCFKRYEKKYLLDRGQYEAMIRGIRGRFVPDEHSNYTVCNVYYDTPDWELIRTSIEKPLYKEKLRVRSYGPVGNDGKVFVELKKKFDGVVYKRREVMRAVEADRFLRGMRPAEMTQIRREIEYFMQSYRPEPKVFIGYDRESYAGAENPDLRITFDTNLRYREEDVDLRKGDEGRLIIPEDKVLMEIKIPGSAPVFLARLLSENGIFSSSFSKYGTYYKNVVLGGMEGPEFISRSTESKKEALKIA